MNTFEPDLADVFVALADSLKAEHGIIDTMDALIHASTQFTSAVEAGIVLADRAGMLHVVASTSERITETEEAQLGIDAGPCWLSFQSGDLVEVVDIAASADRWPRFAAVARERGFRAAHAVPLRLRERMLGSLNLFSDVVGPLSDGDTALAQAFADVATIGIIQQQTIEEGVDLAAQLQYALDSRIVIEQAKGVLAERHDLSIEDAFRLLRTHARNRGARLHDIARQVAANELDL